MQVKCCRKNLRILKCSMFQHGNFCVSTSSESLIITLSIPFFCISLRIFVLILSGNDREPAVLIGSNTLIIAVFFNHSSFKDDYFLISLIYSELAVFKTRSICLFVSNDFNNMHGHYSSSSIRRVHTEKGCTLNVSEYLFNISSYSIYSIQFNISRSH